jgi:glycosyltransferase involved in cell wall biosynthesis
MPDSPSKRRFVFISSNRTWGGSEELWSAAAAVLAGRGHQVGVFKGGLDPGEPRIRRLRELGCRIHDLARLPIPRKLYALLERVAFPFLFAQQILRLRFGLRVSRRADLLVLSQGGNADGGYFAGTIRRSKLPYALIMQKATDLYWPDDHRLEQLRALYAGARACFFVSEHNHRLTEEQLGMALPRAAVVRNPFLVPWEPRPDWPDGRNGLRLACIGRLYTKEKGQDLLLRVLAREKWRNRALSVTFYGSGLNAAGLEQMARFLGLTRVAFGGFTGDLSAVWREHHGLVLPSRCEGLPLVVVEAMLSGRVPIVTDVGGNREVVDDELTGFLAAAATEDALDEALERAWQRRDEWPAIGTAAANRIRELVPPDPAAVMAGMLEELAG